MNCKWVSDDVAAFSKLLYLYKLALFFWRFAYKYLCTIAFCKGLLVSSSKGLEGSEELGSSEGLKLLKLLKILKVDLEDSLRMFVVKKKLNNGIE